MTNFFCDFFTHIMTIQSPKIDGVTRVFFGSDYVTVTKEDGLDWPWVKPDIYQVI